MEALQHAFAFLSARRPVISDTSSVKTMPSVLGLGATLHRQLPFGMLNGHSATSLRAIPQTRPTCLLVVLCTECSQMVRRVSTLRVRRVQAGQVAAGIWVLLVSQGLAV